MPTLATLFALATPVLAAAPIDYPIRPVRLICGYAPGGSLSLVGRMIGQKLAERWGQPFVLDNRPGGGTLIATEIVAKALPDGYTLMIADPVLVLAPVLLKAPYDPIKDFSAIATVSSNELVLLVNPSTPVKTLAEFLDYAKARPGKLQYASAAIGGTQHLTGELLDVMTGIRTHHIPYKGGAPALLAMMAGEVNFHFAPMATATPHAKSGRARPLAVTGNRRSTLLPDVPTFDEAGLANFYNGPRPGNGLVGPAGLPKPIVDKLAAEVARQVSQPVFRESLIGMGSDPMLRTPAEYAGALKGAMAWYSKTIAMLKERGVKFDM